MEEKGPQSSDGALETTGRKSEPEVGSPSVDKPTDSVRPRPGVLGQALLGSHSLVVPIGLLVLIALCAILWLSSPEASPLALPTPTTTALPVAASLPLPMLQHPDAVPNSLYLIQIGVGKDTDVFHLTAASTPTLTNLTKSAGVSEFWPVPSPDGNQVAFYAVNGGVQISLRVLQVDGSVLDLTYRSSASGLNDEYEIDLLHPPTWSPNGGWLAFLARQITGKGHAVELFVVRSDGTEVRRLTNTGNQIMNPV